MKSFGGVKRIWDVGHYIEEPPLRQPPLEARGEGVLTVIEEEEIVRFVETMASIRHPMSLTRLRIKVVEITQELPTPWAGCLPGWSWVRWFHIHLPNHTLCVAHELGMGRARGLCPENVASLYHNFTEMYRKHKYPPSQIWNEDESGAQVGRNDGALVLASRGVMQVHIATPDEHLLVKSWINAVGECIPNISSRANNLDRTTSSLAKKEDLVTWVSWALKKA